jgi:hypothetical protein
MISVIGNFDPPLIRDGLPEEVAQSVAQMVCENLPGGRYIFNTSEGVMCNSPAANVDVIRDAVKRHARQTGLPRQSSVARLQLEFALAAGLEDDRLGVGHANRPTVDEHLAKRAALRVRECQRYFS